MSYIATDAANTVIEYRIPSVANYLELGIWLAVGWDYRPLLRSGHYLNIVAMSALGSLDTRTEVLDLGIPGYDNASLDRTAEVGQVRISYRFNAVVSESKCRSFSLACIISQDNVASITITNIQCTPTGQGLYFDSSVFTSLYETLLYTVNQDSPYCITG